MRIIVKNGEEHIRLVLPTSLVLSAPIAWIADWACGAAVGGKLVQLPWPAAEAVAKLPAGTVSRLFAELRRIKRQYGTWDLVEVESADGEYVLIRL